MEVKTFKVRIKLLEDMLGTTAKQKEVYKKFIAHKVSEAQGEEEAENVQEMEEKGWTGFLKDEEGYFIYNYMVKGFLKNAATTLKQFGATKQLKSKVERYVHVFPRKIRLPDIEEMPLERPLRAITAQGPRVTLVRFDRVKAGTELEFTLELLTEVSGITENCINDLLKLGRYEGLAQWRGGGYGAFEVLGFSEV